MPDQDLKQAVILAGGLGTRLRPLTDTRPKPMIEFHGRPFVGYLIEMLREQGIRRVVLVLGYLPDMVRDYFGDGSRFGVEISYSVSPVEDETGLRLKKARLHLDPIFLLLYCDNYWPMSLARMWAHYKNAGAPPAMITVYDNADGYTRDNLRVSEDGFVAVYDKSRQSSGLSGVDIGFMIVRRELVDDLPDGNVSFEAESFSRLAADRKLLAFVTQHRYYSVGSHQRLPLTEEFLARRPTVILDRDGVLNRCMPTGKYVRSWKEWVWLPGVLETLARLTEAGYKIVVVTNQAGIARGVMSLADVEDIHGRMRVEAEAAGGRIDAVYFCPHGWDENCSCRKPQPGMLFSAQRDFHLELPKVTFIGDDDRDGEAAAAAGCQFLKVDDNTPLSRAVDRLLGSHH
jgi:D-glycero-D-manno-heptose 1,7-bisphosphate phosphatase